MLRNTWSLPFPPITGGLVYTYYDFWNDGKNLTLSDTLARHMNYSLLKLLIVQQKNVRLCDLEFVFISYIRGRVIGYMMIYPPDVAFL